jgi:molybdopterin molybdotransferase
MPSGADTIVIQERSRRQENRVFVLAKPKQQEFVRHKGEFYKAGAQLLQGGIKLTAPEIAVLASAQCSQLSVYRKPKVAILSTGDELVTPGKPLKAGQIVDSNQYALASAIIQSGAEPVMLGIVKDEEEALSTAMTIALESADVVISSGGVSVGDYDYVEKLLESKGGKIHIRSVAVKPGKPLTVASFQEKLSSKEKLYFGLPGNPVSALVTYWRFVQPAIRKLAGMSQGWEAKFISARTHYDLHADGKRESYLWGKLDIVDGVYEFHLAGGSHSSGNLINLAQTNALGIVPIGQTLIAKGEEIQVMLVG